MRLADQLRMYADKRPIQAPEPPPPSSVEGVAAFDPLLYPDAAAYRKVMYGKRTLVSELATALGKHRTSVYLKLQEYRGYGWVKVVARVRGKSAGQLADVYEWTGG